MDDLYLNTLIENVSQINKGEILLRFKRHNFKESNVISYDYHGEKLSIVKVNGNSVICKTSNPIQELFLEQGTKYYLI